VSRAAVPTVGSVKKVRKHQLAFVADLVIITTVADVSNYTLYNGKQHNGDVKHYTQTTIQLSSAKKQFYLLHA